MSAPGELSKPIKLRAGIAQYDDESKMCTPISVQGEIIITPNEDEEELGFYDFEWRPIEKPTDPSITGISLILIPDETVLVPIKSTSNGRIFALVFSSNQVYFFWLQEKNPANLKLDELNNKDKEIFDMISKLLTSDDNEEEEEEADEQSELLNEKEDVEIN